MRVARPRQRNAQGHLRKGVPVQCGVLALFLLGACLSDDSAAPLCLDDNDCDRGEHCSEGLCFGDPPHHITFAALLTPPAENNRSVVPTEVPILRIADDGTISNLTFDPAVRISGRVTLSCPIELGLPCSTAPQATDATILVEKPSRIPGGTPFQLTVLSTASDGFTIDLPKSHCQEGPSTCEDAYHVTVLPKSQRGKVLFEESSTALAPPLRFELAAQTSQTVTWKLGQTTQVKAARGCAVDKNGKPIAGLTAVAMARRSPLGPPVRASSRGITNAQGCFDLILNRGSDSYDVVIEPEDVGEALPRIRWRDRLIPDPLESFTFDLGTVTVPAVAKPVPFHVRVTGRAAAGDIQPVAGSQLVFTARVPSSLDPEVEVQIAVRGESTDATGETNLALVPDLNYDVDVLPPPGSAFAATFATTAAVGGSSSLLIDIGRRLPVRGNLRRFSGKALRDTRLQATLSPSFLATADEDTHGLVAGFALPGVTTGSGGDYQIFLDRDLHGVDAVYDLSIEPPISSGAPAWSIDSVHVRGVEWVDLGEIRLPDNSWARGDIVDAGGTPVPGAQLQLFELRGPSACAGRCQPAPYRRGSFAADKKGHVKVLLPDPPPPGGS